MAPLKWWQLLILAGITAFISVITGGGLGLFFWIVTILCLIGTLVLLVIDPPR